ncbi:NAD(P)-dependent oxidoreductase [Streptomyces spectabilis]|uniref:NAD-dependent epimerase/dehydratase family protein n=1 Tax=Streptomyces spectabilis TaxID=68270 RepID=A0A5P2XGC5_STRST|nr:NAD(P)H-binding protein [Streptomyces spectabilis]MBB5108686.1 putative NADH-flavin reductase [Streptomyces spectabilis]MCI3904486.1 NAD(P)H-binding protein [Streptomyces spectabilis]QEV61576.1 NAD-dependent epimerase/dehydratase family protein [Streptomyces spectabilis]GGV27511.1 NADH-flavin reductase [Streptomyces spectabilis]
MRITVFGASGGIGGEIVRQGLAAGHEVTAVVRDPARLTAAGDRLEVVRSDLTDARELRGAVAGRDAVLSGLGARGNADARAGIATRLTVPVLRAMEAVGVRRLLLVSAAPLGRAAERDPLLDRATMAVVSRVFKAVYADLRAMEGELARSATDWTSVRPPRLLDQPLTGTYRTAVGHNPRSARQIGRADVAHAMLTMIDDPATVKQGVGVAY